MSTKVLVYKHEYVNYYGVLKGYITILECSFTRKPTSTATRVAILGDLVDLRSIGTSLANASVIRFPSATLVLVRINAYCLLNVSYLNGSDTLSHLTLMLSWCTHNLISIAEFKRILTQSLFVKTSGFSSIMFFAASRCLT